MTNNTSKENKALLNQFEEINLSKISLDEITVLADTLFQLFKENFERNNFTETEKIAKWCKNVTDYSLKKKSCIRITNIMPGH